MSSDIDKGTVALRQQYLREAIAADIGKYLADCIYDATKSCLTCDHFAEHNGEICTLYKARPPAKIIAFGCPSYVNEIPF